MFNKISKNKLKNVLLFKFFFSLFIGPFIILFLFFLACDLSCEMVELLKLAEPDGRPPLSMLKEMISGWVFWGTYGLMVLFGNIVGLIRFILLIIDAISGKTVENEIIEIKGISQCQELFATIREKKRFLIDSFSRKENCEFVMKGDNKKRFYLFWNESYGDKNKYNEFLDSKVRKKLKSAILKNLK